MRSKAIFMALLAFAFAAQAAQVTQSQAVSAVNRWVRSGSVLGTRLGSRADVSRMRTYAVSAVTPQASVSTAFYAVPLQDGQGTVFVAGGSKPAIVAFTQGNSAELSEDSPLYRILTADALFRSHFATTAAPVPEDEAGDVISDLRVAPLLTTRWTQPQAQLAKLVTQGKTVAVTNTETAYLDGCTATAAAQIMKYWKYPAQFPVLGEKLEDQLKSLAFPCEVDGATVTLLVKANDYLTCDMPAYEWDQMADEPTAGNYSNHVNHILFDVATVLGSSFADGNTGASPANTAKAFARFSYPSAFVYWDGTTYQDATGGLHKRELRERTIYTNLDAQRPVQLGIYGWRKDKKGVLQKDNDNWVGHSVVADGYGFASAGGTGAAYVHINLGWGGTDDAWYNIPEIDTAAAGATVADQSGAMFKFLGSATFNISTNETDAGLELLTGRLTDADGKPVAGATVTAVAEGSDPERVTSDANGIYSLPLPGGADYDVSAERIDASGMRIIGRVPAPVSLVATKADADGVVNSKEKVGNSWGNDMTLIHPTVRIVRGGAVADEYATLDQALAEVQSGDRVELVEPTTLAADSFLAASVTICATNDNPYAAMIARIDGATLSVTNGTTVLSNIVFKTEATTPVFATDKGHVWICGTVVLDDIVSGVPGLVTEKATNFKLVGLLENGLTYECRGESGADAVCGTYACDQEEADVSARRIVSASGVDRACRAEMGDLIWADDAAVDPAVAVASVGADYYRTLDRAFEANPAGAEVVVLKSGARISKPLTLGADSAVSGAPGVEIVTEDGFGFIVTNGTLTVSGVSFAGATGPGLFVVDGGSLALSDSAIDGAKGTNIWSGAVAVLKGTAGLTNVVIRNCRATGKMDLASRVYRAYGGGAFVGGAGASLFLKACTIEDCWAASEGGGISVRAGGTLCLDGKMTVRDNTCGENLNEKPNDICFADPDGRLQVTGQLFGDRTVGVRYNTDNSVGDRPGDVFAIVELGAVASSNACADAFFNDTDATVEAIATGREIFWQTVKEEYGTDNRLPTSLVRVSNHDGTKYYDRLKYALQELTDVSQVELLGDETFAGTQPLNFTALLCSDTTVDDRFSLTDTGDGVIDIADGVTLAFDDIAFTGATRREGTDAQLELYGEMDGSVTVGESVPTPAFGAAKSEFLASDLVAATNSAANFVRADRQAYGLVATNANLDAKLVWSDAFDAKGEIVLGGQTYYGIGDFGGEPPVQPLPIAFTSIANDRAAHTWTVAFTQAVATCWYSLYETNSLVGGFKLEGISPVAIRQATASDVPEMKFTRDENGEQLFWKVVAEPSDAH